jgi:hypothetical protein
MPRALSRLAASDWLVSPSKQLPLSLVSNKQAQVVIPLVAHGNNASNDGSIAVQVNRHVFGFARIAARDFLQELVPIVESYPVGPAETELGRKDAIKPDRVRLSRAPMLT